MGLWYSASAFWGLAFGVALWPSPQGTLLANLTAAYAERQIGRLDMERRKHLEMADVPTDTIMNWQVGLFVVTLLPVVAGASFAVGFGFVSILLGIVAAGFVSWTVPMWATLAPYRHWQEQVYIGIPDFVSFLPVYLEAGYNTRQSMERAAADCREPLRGEMKKALQVVQLTGNPYAAFERLSANVGLAELDQILSRISSLWNQRISPDVLRDMKGQFRSVRDLAAEKVLAGSTIRMVGAVFLFGFAILFIWGGVGIGYVSTHIGSMLSGH